LENDVTAQLARDLAAFLPEAHTLTPADLAECAAQPAAPDPMPQVVDVDFSGVSSTLLKAFNEDALKDSLSIYYSPWTQAFRLSWRGQAIDGVVAVRADDDGLLVTTAAGIKRVRPGMDKAKAEVAEVVEAQAQPAAGPSPVSQSIAEFLSR
jgi:hypothetical protein